MRRSLSRQLSSKAFTIIEVATYVALISISMTMLISFEVMTKQSVNDQRIQLQVAQQPDLLFRELSSDVANAARIELLNSGAELRLTLFDKQVVSYRAGKNPMAISPQCLIREALRPNVEKPFTIPFPRLSQHKFSIRNSQSKRPIVCLELQAFRSRANGNTVTTPFKWAFRPIKPQN